MNKFLSVLSLACALTTVGSMAHAGELSYDDFVKSCQNPGSYGHQKPPSNIRVQCKNVQKAWEPLEAGGTSLSESRIVSAEVFSDKSHVQLQSFNVTVPELTIACPRFREVTETAQIEKAVTCEQVLADPKTLQELCTAAIDEAIAANPDIVEIVPTGKIYNICTGNGQKP
ncbi:MAG: hypothetical protein ACOYL6_16315 [Bacteriovoracaceae bacterium]